MDNDLFENSKERIRDIEQVAEARRQADNRGHYELGNILQRAAAERGKDA